MTERTLALAVGCLEPVRHKLVVVGGTAHRLFPLHEHGHDPGFELLTTEDVDWAAPLELGHDASDELLERLRRAGFRDEVRGVLYPAHIYRLPDDRESYLQFIAPTTGSGRRRDGSSDRLLRFSGIRAEKLPHVDVLLHRPWTTTLQIDGTRQSLQVVNPVAYLLQKLLVLPTRGARRGKDLLYIFDTLSIFGDALDELAAGAADLAPELSANAAKKVRQATDRLCFSEGAVSRAAAAIAASQRSRPPESSQIVAACKLGLRRVLGGVVTRL